MDNLVGSPVFCRLVTEELRKRIRFQGYPDRWSVLSEELIVSRVRVLTFNCDGGAWRFLFRGFAHKGSHLQGTAHAIP